MNGQMPFLDIEQLGLSYAESGFTVTNFSFSLEEGQLGCLLGPSGCGKSSVLRAIAGFQSITHGKVLLDQRALSTPSKVTPPELRNIGMVFQDHALFPHLTVYDNVGFGLRRLTSRERKIKIDSLLEMVGLMSHKTQYPHELSGGQSQRVALARALAPEPKLMLLDEPFSSLDAEMREDLGYQVRDWLKALNITSILVTHDQHDAFALGDKIAVMRNGQIEQVDTSFNLYHAPRNRFVAQFIGEGVFINATVDSITSVSTSFGALQGEVIGSPQIGAQCEILLRPDDVSLSSQSAIRGHIERKSFKGAQTLYAIRLTNNEKLLALASSHEDFKLGDEVGIEIQADHLVCF